MANAAENYGKIVKGKNGETAIVFAPKTMSERARARFGFLPVRFEAYPAKGGKTSGRKPVLRDGYIEMAFVYPNEPNS